MHQRCPTRTVANMPHPSTPRPRTTLLGACAALLIVAAACQPTDTQPTTTVRPTPTTTAPAPSTTPTTTTTRPATTTTTTVRPSEWRQVFFDDFTTPVAEGSFPGPAYSTRWGVYPDGGPDTAGKTPAQGGESAASRYYPTRVLSVSGGNLVKRLRVENGVPLGAGLVPLLPGTPAYNPNLNGGWPQITNTTTPMRYGRYTIRFRSTSAAGFKAAWLLWPSSEVWPRDGEVDFPEANLNGNICAFMHRQGATSGSDQDAFCGATPMAGRWHTATIERAPDHISFILNGVEVGRSTNRLPDTPMAWRIQTETCFYSCQPAANAAATIEIDWVRIEARNT